jgi:hypothetical protein
MDLADSSKKVPPIQAVPNGTFVVISIELGQANRGELAADVS